MVKEFLMQLVFDILRIFGSMLLTVFALYCGMKLLDRLTVGIEEWEEIKKGNVAVGILYASVMISIILMTSSAIMQFGSVLGSPFMSLLWVGSLLLSLILYGLNLFAAIVIIYLVFNVVDKLTVDIEEVKELKKGNVAVAIILSIIIIAVASIIREPLFHIFQIGKTLSLFF
jgi:uncharacterized membrane protein YjfL (UPF0719 family)